MIWITDRAKHYAITVYLYYLLRGGKNVFCSGQMADLPQSHILVGLHACEHA